MQTQEVGETINATNIVEGVSPHWNEMIYADISEDNGDSEGNQTLIFENMDEDFLCRNYYSCY